MRDFDDIIRGKLAALPTGGVPDWGALEARLDGEAFDALVSGGLGTAAADARPAANAPGEAPVVPLVPGWDRLAARLDAGGDAGGEVFDRILAGKVAATGAPLSAEATWQRLSHRMDTAWPLRRRLARYRVLEVAAAVALLLSFVPLLRDNPAVDRYGALVLERLDLGGDAEADSFSSAPSTLAPRALDPIARVDATARLRDARAPGAGEPLTPGRLLRRAYAWATGSDRDAALASTPTPTRAGFGETGTDASAAAATQGLTPSEPRGQHEPFTVSALAADAPEVLATRTPTLAAFVPAAPSPARRWRLGPDAGARAWTIRTPTDESLNLPAVSRRRVGVSAGVSAVADLSPRLGLGLGVSVTPVSYDPDLPAFVIQDAVRQGLDRIEVFDDISTEILQVPVELRRRLTPPGAPVQVSAKAGVTASALLRTRYNIRESVGDAEPLLAMSPQPAPSAPGGEPVPTAVPAQAPLAEVKEFAPGLLGGGRLADNAYLSARVGLEAEAEVLPRLHVFTSLDYERFVLPDHGVGPNGDRPSSLGLAVGARFSL